LPGHGSAVNSAATCNLFSEHKFNTFKHCYFRGTTSKFFEAKTMHLYASLTHFFRDIVHLSISAILLFLYFRYEIIPKNVYKLCHYLHFLDFNFQLSCILYIGTNFILYILYHLQNVYQK
jgi:hypothetical protein